MPYFNGRMIPYANGKKKAKPKKKAKKLTVARYLKPRTPAQRVKFTKSLLKKL